MENKAVDNHQDPAIPVAGGLNSFHGKDNWNSTKDFLVKLGLTLSALASHCYLPLLTLMRSIQMQKYLLNHALEI